MSPAAREYAARHFATRATITADQWAVIDLERQAQTMSAFTGATITRRMEKLFEIAATTPRPAA